MTSKSEYTGRRRKRLCLVLDCLIPHDFSDQNVDLINLQHYVIKEKKLSEKEAIVIFYDIVRVVECLHKVIVFTTCRRFLFALLDHLCVSIMTFMTVCVRLILSNKDT